MVDTARAQQPLPRLTVIGTGALSATIATNRSAFTPTPAARARIGHTRGAPGCLAL